ncbi:MAG: LytR/AlgR family response regulator transcription factor [Flavobacteriales bacterium]
MSKKLKCLLLDDELPGLTYLRMMCEQIEQVEVTRAYNDPLKLVEEAGALDFDFCILDIEMPGLNGMQVAQSLEGKPVIFTTAYKEYAAEAFDLEAVDYIRKPLQKERLEKAISRVYQFMREPKTRKSFVQLNTNKGKTVLFFNQIAYLTTAENDKRDKQVILKTGEDFILKNISFHELLALLPAENFCQVNKKEIIAIDTVRFFSHTKIVSTVKTKEGQDITLVLSDNFRQAFLQKTQS